MQFGISTHLYQDERLRRDHLADVASHGFEAIELVAARSHFDYHDPAAVADLGVWLQETGLRLHAVHAPVDDAFSSGDRTQPRAPGSTASGDRARALAEVEAALAPCREIETGFLVLHLGSLGPDAAGGGRALARDTLQALQGMVRPLGVRLAIEVMPNELSTPASLVRLLEEELELPDAGVCLDFGHAFLQGDLVDAIETLSGLVVTTHVHDNDGRSDAHLVPFDGRIDWPAALMAVQKVGYEGTMLMELGATGPPREVLGRGQRARRQMERLLAS